MSLRLVGLAAGGVLGVALLAPASWAASADPRAPASGMAVVATPPPSGVDVGPPSGGPPAPPPAGEPVSSDGTSGGGGPGFFDLPGRLRQAINDWFADLVASALSPALDLLGQTVLATPPVTDSGRVRDLWGISAGVANAGFVLLVVIGAAVVMGHETLQSRYAAKDIAPRVVLAVVAANASLALAGQGIGVANALTRAFLGEGVSPAEASARMRALALGPLQAGGIFLVLLALVAAGLALVLLVVYVGRVALVVVLAAAAPLALAGHALPHTDGVARLWWRAFAACLVVQVGQALVLVTALRVFFGADGHAVLGLASGGSLVDLVVLICLLWVLVRIPSWARRAVFSRTSSPLLRTATRVIVARARSGGAG
jgi:hypothetical protein